MPFKLVSIFLLLLPQVIFSADWSEDKLFKAFSNNEKIPLKIIYKTLIGDHRALRAKSATYLGSWGNKSSVPYLITALADETFHVGAKYRDQGLATTRYRAYLSLLKLTHQDFPFDWDASVSRRSKQIKRWRKWFYKDLKNKEYIIEQIQKENECEQDSNCALLPSKCPFGCDRLVHNKSIEKVKILINWFENKCEYKCMPPRSFKCVDHKCMVKENH